MKAMLLERTARLEKNPHPLRLAEVETPRPQQNEVLLKVAACGVCHTELDEIEGRLNPPTLPVIPGHEVVGEVVEVGPDASRLHVGDRVGVGWIHHSSGQADENLSQQFTATGCDVNGGYAEFMTAPESYAVPIPNELDSTQAAPLLCAGAIGYRALRLTGLRNREHLGLMGFGASAHLVLATAKHLFPHSKVFVFTRGDAVQRFALERGADWAGGIAEAPPHKVNAIIDTTPVWKPVVESMKKLLPGGRLVINAIRKEDSDKQTLLELSYHEHLWMEREIKSVANLTFNDISQFIPLAARIPIRPQVTVFPLHKANDALQRIRQGNTMGAQVLIPKY